MKVLIPAIQTLFWVASDLLFPRCCQICQKGLPHENRTYLCDRCATSVRYISDKACRGCAREFPGAALLKEDKNWVCPECSGRKRSFDACFAVCHYEGVVKDLLHAFKYSRAQYLTSTLQKVFLRRAMPVVESKNIDLIVPVAMHPRKYKERGYNQSWALAKSLARKISVPALEGALQRVKYTAGQTLQDKHARQKSIQGSFCVKNNNPFKGKNILLVDDVMTTGATLQECSKVLKEAGAQWIAVLVLARSG